MSGGSQPGLNFFTASNGTRQGGILSPFLFCRYIRDLLTAVAQSGIGCNIGGVFTARQHSSSYAKRCISYDRFCLTV